MAGKDTKAQCLVVVWQFMLILWKNFLLQIRRPFGTAAELIIPPAAVVVLIGLRFGVFTPEDRCFATFPSDPLTIPLPNNSYQIFYTPMTPNTMRVASCIEKALFPIANVTGVDSEAELEEMLQEDRIQVPISVSVPGIAVDSSAGCFIRGAGIVFDDLDGSDDTLEYTLRLRHDVGSDDSWETRTSGPAFQLPGPRVTNNFYLSEGFVHLESIVGEAIIRLMANPEMSDCNGTLQNEISVSMRQLPYPEYTVDIFLTIIVTILPFFVILAYIYSAGVFTKELVLEKETRIRESMLMMGLQQWVLWTTWFIKQFIILFISAFLMVVLLKFGQVFPESDFFLLLIFFILFLFSAISFSFLLSVWFNTARVGLLVGFLGWFLNYLPYFFVPGNYSTFDLGSKVAFCTLSNTCMGLGVNTIALLEIRGEGVQWNNFYQDISLDDDFHIGYVFFMLIIDSIVYMLIAWYVNGVKPGQYGVPKPFYFPFQPSYWLGRPLTSSKMKDAQQLVGGAKPNYDPTAHEDEPKDLSVGISIQNLTKIYDENFLVKVLASHEEREKKRKVAVNELNLSMYEGQITALLGHNGAGKTTTMSILTGLYTPTSGTAVINGYDIRTNMDQIRQSLGICPQHNVLFDRLTVMEHLKLFGRLKGLKGEALKKEAEGMIADLQLQDKRDVPSSNLSGGMKRKLSVGIALIGGSKIVVLDEPTSGIDPYARRAIWDLLSKHKEGRTMLLTTHFMDEADLLGDRIAIMAEGKLRCSGSSLFLKSRYGVGYHMVVVKEPSCNSATVNSLIQSHVQGGKNVTDVGTELSYVLPSNSSQSFPQLFEALEARKSELGIAGFGISVTTMEEVFIKVGEGTDESLERRVERTGTLTSLPPVASPTQQQAPAALSVEVEVTIEDSTLSKLRPPSPPKDFVHNSGLVLWFQQFCAMFLKRLYNTMRFWQAIFSQLILPLLFVLFALILAVTLPNANENDPSRALNVENSGLDSSNRFLFYAEFDEGDTSIFDFDSVENIGATSFESYADFAQEIITGVRNVSVDDCCDYKKQILDKFCAVQDNLGRCSSSFGYSKCEQCLDCCTATSSLPRSCTYPLYQNSEPNREDLCPTPPRISYEDAINNATGRLDSNLVYVDEYLLQKAEDIDPEVYIRRLLGGFVLNYMYREPEFGSCGDDSVEEAVNENFAVCREIEESEYYTLVTANYDVSDLVPGVALPLSAVVPWLNSEQNCPEFGNITNGSSGDAGLDADSLVDGLSVDLFNLGVCNLLDEDTSPSIFTPSSTLIPQKNIQATVYYNNNPWHMSAASLNAFHNVWLRQSTNNPDLRLTVNNHPLPRSAESEVLASTQNFNGYSIGTMVVFGYSFLLASFVLFLVNEKETKAKHLQFVSGVHVTSYWLATFAWDLLNAMVPVIVSFLLFAAFQVDGYTGDALGGIFLLLFFTCWSTIPIVYCISFLFSNSLVAFGLIIIGLFFSSQIFLVVTLVLTDMDVVDGLHYFFLVDPAYNLAAALNDLYTNNLVREACTASDLNQFVCENDDRFRFVDDIFSTDRPGIGVNIIYFVFEGILFFILTLLIEYNFFIPEIRGLIIKAGGFDAYRGMEASNMALPGEDDDVQAERKKIMSGALKDDDVIVIKEIVKEYGSRLDGCTVRPPKLAVRGINLTVPRSECFGLLGVNGAGKTTTFSMLTGEISPTSGTAVISGYDIRADLRKVQQQIGYCPQFDALIERMTGRELLTMFARLRGIPERLISQAVEAEVVRLDFAKHASKQCGKYSGGNKRKLSTALALVGNPPIVFLDEPTTGMDPATRRYLWDVLTAVTREGRSIVLTSHSMEECEALCTRLAIMVNGRFKCLGGIQHLKNKYGSGFNLQARVNLNPPPETEVPRSRKLSFLRQGSNQSHPNSPRSPDGHRPKRFSFKRQGSQQNTPVQTSEGTFDMEGANPEKSVSSIQAPIPLGGETASQYGTNALNIFIKETFSGAVKLEEHQGSVTYQLPSAGLSWSSVFRQLEANKERLGIIDYSVSQTTLEQVFINFAKEQDEDDN